MYNTCGALWFTLGDINKLRRGIRRIRLIVCKSVLVVVYELIIQKLTGEKRFSHSACGLLNSGVYSAATSRRGASLNMKNISKRTPLHLAQVFRHTDIMKLPKNKEAELAPSADIVQPPENEVNMLSVALVSDPHFWHQYLAVKRKKRELRQHISRIFEISAHFFTLLLCEISKGHSDYGNFSGRKKPLLY